MPELKSCARDEGSDVDGKKVSARAATAPAIPVTMVVSKPSPIELTSRHLPMRVKRLLPFGRKSFLQVSDHIFNKKNRKVAKKPSDAIAVERCALKRIVSGPVPISADKYSRTITARTINMTT